MTQRAYRFLMIPLAPIAAFLGFISGGFFHALVYPIIVLIFFEAMGRNAILTAQIKAAKEAEEAHQAAL